MPVERRGQVIALKSGQPATGGTRYSTGRRQPSRGGTSRMTRECQVRICERLGVQFPGPTRQFPGPTRQPQGTQPRPRGVCLPFKTLRRRRHGGAALECQLQTCASAAKPRRLFDHLVGAAEQRKRAPWRGQRPSRSLSSLTHV